MLEERRDLLTELVRATDGTLQQWLDERAQVQPFVDESLLDSWDEERARATDEHNDNYIVDAIDEELQGDDSDGIDLAQYARTTAVGSERLAVGCRAPELIDGPDQETIEEPPPGRLGYYRIPASEEEEQDVGGHVVLVNVDGTGEHELEIAEDPELPDDPLTLETLLLPLATSSCSDFITDDRIVVSMGARVLDDGDTAVWTVGLDGSDPQELYRAEGCNALVGGQAQRVTTGVTSTPKWPPDGEWLVFGYAAPGQGDGVSTWIAQPDGDQLREVVPFPAWTPVWLPPA